MNQHLRIAIPLSLAVVLSICFMILLRDRMEDSESTVAEPAVVVEAPKKRIPGNPKFAADSPIGTVEEPEKTPPKRRFYGRKDGLFRWNIQELPKGWDPTLAKSVHNYFELMDKLEAATKANDSGADLEKARQELRDMLAALGPDALATLDAILNHEGDFVYRRFLMNGIGEMGAESELATLKLRDYFMKRQKEQSQTSEAKHVIKAMAKLQNGSSFEVLQQLISDKNVSRFRTDLIEALGEHHQREQAAGFIADGLHESSRKTVRNKFAQALGKIRSPDSLPDLYHAFEKENYWVAKQTILGSVGKIGDPNSVPFLEEKARYSREGAVRLAAGRALFRVGTPYAIDTLKDIAQSEPEPKLRSLMEKWAAGEE